VERALNGSHNGELGNSTDLGNGKVSVGDGQLKAISRRSVQIKETYMSRALSANIGSLGI
jgi:hypothetical protein